jgi:hypothetical protein
MTHPPSKLPADTLASLEHYIEWLNSRGQRLNATRLKAYYSLYKTKFTKPPPIDDETFHAFINEYVFIEREITELLWILSAVEHNTPHGFDEIMSKVLGGQLVGRDDSDQLNSRDFQFQLRIAAYFSKAGFAVDLSTSADVKASKDGYTYFIECKRLKSPQKVAARISEAYEQIIRHIKPVSFRSGFYGIAAFDITKIMQPHLGLSYAETFETVLNVNRGQISEFCKTYEYALAHKRIPRILDVWLQILCPACLASGQGVFTPFSSLHLSTNAIDGPKYKAYSVLLDAFEQR